MNSAKGARLGPARIVCAVVITSAAALADNPDALTDSMTDEQLRVFRQSKVKQLQERAREFQPERTQQGVVYRDMFFCSVYYTPMESGFTTERGFDATLVSAAGLHGRKYPRDFLAAVKKEGFGRTVEPVDGHNYIHWGGGDRFGYASAPVGRHGELLIPRRSCAVSSRNKFIHQHARLSISSPTVNGETGSKEWFVCDTGPGVAPLQIDLYWGEDEPRGAVGRQRARPKGTWMEYAFEVDVIAKD